MQKTLSIVNLTAITQNAKTMRKRIGSKFFYAVVKANAYGHGALPVSHQIQPIVDGFCVALIEEGIALRAGGITKPILVLTPPQDSSQVAFMRHYELTATVNGVSCARLLGDLPCHIKVNTGMNRYGCSLTELENLLALPLNVEGVYSHLFAVDNPVCNVEQRRLFMQAEGAVKAVYPHAIAHLSATGGVLCGDKYLFDGARCGISLYGYTPRGFSLKGLAPALKVYAKRMQQTDVVGYGVGYAVAQKKYDTLSTYRLGYADGFDRRFPFGESNLCMDAFVAKDNGEWYPVLLDADQIAKKLGTISYEVLVNATRRSQIIYEKSTKSAL